ncbi:MAG: WYL domain-containing protein [Alphaproteobacteria bacterium]|nr:WYL domain-containing protein [Alphaproteobacteria bacterium]
MPMRDDYCKFSELLDLIQILCRPDNGLTYDDIMGIMTCSRKTAERTVKFLSERFGDAFVVLPDPINSKQHRFRLEMPDKLPPEYITSDDLIGLNAAVNQIKNTIIHKNLETLEYKLHRIVQTKKSVRELNDMEAMILSRTNTAAPYPHIKTDETDLNILQQAVIASTKVKVTYMYNNGGIEQCTLCPLGFLYGHSNNYLVAYKDGDKKIIRTYILGQLNDVQLTNKHFNPGQFDIKKYANLSFGMFHSVSGPYDVEWLADADVSDAILRYNFHPTQKFIKNDDGTTTIKMRADGFYEMSWYLFQWQGNIKPVAPQELVNTYHELLNNIIKNTGV